MTKEDEAPDGATLARRELEEKDRKLAGTFRAPAAINARLDHARARFHLVSPFPAVGRLPEGFAVQIAIVHVDPDHEAYSVGGGKLAPLKVAVDRIGHALGISWDIERSRRLDDARDPRYCHWRAVGAYRSSDGTMVTISGNREVDARDGSDQIAGKSSKEVGELRKHVLSHAETKARLRAIRSMGLASSYTREALERPFACVRLAFTGECEDPTLRARFAEILANAALGAGAAAYGGEVPFAPVYQGAPSLPPPREEREPVRVRHPAPPVNRPAEVLDADAFEVSAPRPVAARAATHAATPSAPEPVRDPAPVEAPPAQEGSRRDPAPPLSDRFPGDEEG